MKNEKFADRLNLALDKEGFPPKHKGRIQLLAEMVGLTHRGASKWVNGEACPPAKKYADLAIKLSVRKEWLKTGEGPMLEEVEELLIKPEASIAIPVYLIENFEKTNRVAIETISCNLPMKGEAFAIKLETEAMSPRFPSTSIIIFDPKKEATDGSFVLVKSSAYPVPIFRQLLKIGGDYLEAHNPKFDRLFLTSSDKIIGVMVQAIISFD